MTRYFHGARERGPYFEGWYFKFQGKNGDALALIPAFHIDPAGRRSASLQVLTRDGSWWLDYPEADFHARADRLSIRMGESVFTRQGVQLRVEREGLSLHGTVTFGPFRELKSDIMGPFRFLPKMECSHGVISMAHALEGQIVQNGRVLDLSGGTGYVETDRGRSFPDRYLWTQCVWQEPPCGSLMLSAATIPTPVGSFRGCICAVLYRGREYRLATYRGAKIQRWDENGAVICQGRCRLEVQRMGERGQPLRAPVGGAMARTVHESLCGRVHYRFWTGGKLLFERTDSAASFETSAHET